MAYTIIFDDIVFIEGGHSSASIIKDTKVDLGGIGAQLKNLSDVKKELALRVRTSGGNCLVDFKYGQKSRWLAIDDVAFWGSGKIAKLPEEIYNDYIKSMKK